ncbi:hypothetical protein [Mangrovihabitans endophyticus]|uniref:hypothetical protein n=1 Tax=Mangrovihabitans endophyticus TaxID=1751298 RepID=UPI00166C497A|nr:hypothetical protein [Mangrovihabitans endophyticus]
MDARDAAVRAEIAKRPEPDWSRWPTQIYPGQHSRVVDLTPAQRFRASAADRHE